MARALELAHEAACAGEVPVGAVVFDSSAGTIVGEGRNQSIAAHDPTAHAEIVALRVAAARLGNYRLTGLSLYVTLEPCAMCAGAISFARIGRLVFAADDVKGGAVANGARFFEQPTCHWRTEWARDPASQDAAAALLTSFFRRRRRPSDL